MSAHAVGELCRRLGGLPLAIELIAGWVGTLSMREIVQQRVALLDYDPPGAHGGSRKLADVLRASYDLLQPGQRANLRLLSVFITPFSLADAQAVSGLSEQEAAGAIRGLVDASWLVVTRSLEQNRFSMVETIREFAAARLREAGEAPQARRRHAMHFADVAIQSLNSLVGPDGGRWTARLASAVDDQRAMLQWALENGEIALGLEVGAALWRWWLTTGRLSSGRAWLDKFLTAAGEHPARTAEESQRIGRALCAAALLAVENDDYAEAVRLATQALGIFEPLESGEDLAFAATVLGSAQRCLGDRADARRSFQTAFDVRAAAGDPVRLAAALNNMALVELDDGNLDRARELFERNLVIKRQLGEPTLDRDRPDQPGRGADQGRPVAGRPAIYRRGRRAGRRPALITGPRAVQPGPPRGAAAKLGAGGRALPGVGGRLPGGRHHARRDRGHDRIGPRPSPAWPGRGSGRAATHRGGAAHQIGNRQLMAEVAAALAEAGAGRPLASRQLDLPPGRGAAAARGRPEQQGDRRAALPEPGAR